MLFFLQKNLHFSSLSPLCVAPISIKFQTFNLILLFRFGDGDDDDGASSVTASKPTKNPVLEKLGAEDGNISVAGVTNVVKDRVGNLLGKGIGGIGGLSTKFGGGSWF